jgi:hypothetical protein
MRKLKTIIFPGLLICAAALFAVAVGRPDSPDILLIEGVTAPRAVATDGRHLFVLDGTGLMITFDRDGRELRRLRLVKTERGFPAGVAVEPEGTLLIADSHEYRILRMNVEGERLSAFGSGPGSGDGEFIYPQRFAFANDEIFVSEYGFGPNNRVQVFTPDGRFLRSFGDYGTEGGAFSRPCGIAAGPDSTIFVADASHRILKWSAVGEYQGDIGAAGTGPGQLDYPFGLIRSGRHLLVIEYGNERISRFTLDGSFAGDFTAKETLAGGFKRPRDLAADADYIFVADTGNDRVVRIKRADITWEGLP